MSEKPGNSAAGAPRQGKPARGYSLFHGRRFRNETVPHGSGGGGRRASDRLVAEPGLAAPAPRAFKGAAAPRSPLTYWLLDAAPRQLHPWHEQGELQPLSIDLPARDLRDPKLLERVEGALATWGVEPEWIALELTESARMLTASRSQTA